jgi:CO/xanthine dehydrogenase FAD-binding subunit
VRRFDYARPATVGEAVELLARHRGAARVLAGGTDLVVGLRQHTVTPGLVVDVVILGPGRTALEPVELVTAVELGIPRQPTGTAFARMTRRRGVDLATVSVCCSVAADGVTRFAYGAAAPRPFLVADPGGTLADPEAGEDRKASVIEELVAAASPITDVRASREYRLAMLRVLSRRALARALDRLARARATGGRE